MWNHHLVFNHAPYCGGSHVKLGLLQGALCSIGPSQATKDSTFQQAIATQTIVTWGGFFQSHTKHILDQRKV